MQERFEITPSTTKEDSKPPYIGYLPQDMWAEIIKHLDSFEIGRLTKTARPLKELADRHVRNLLKTLCSEKPDLWHYYLVNPNKETFFSYFKTQLNNKSDFIAQVIEAKAPQFDGLEEPIYYIFNQEVENFEIKDNQIVNFNSDAKTKLNTVWFIISMINKLKQMEHEIYEEVIQKLLVKKGRLSQDEYDLLDRCFARLPNKKQVQILTEYFSLDKLNFNLRGKLTELDYFLLNIAPKELFETKVDRILRIAVKAIEDNKLPANILPKQIAITCAKKYPHCARLLCSHFPWQEQEAIYVDIIKNTWKTHHIKKVLATNESPMKLRKIDRALSELSQIQEHLAKLPYFDQQASHNHLLNCYRLVQDKRDVLKESLRSQIKAVSLYSVIMKLLSYSSLLGSLGIIAGAFTIMGAIVIPGLILMLVGVGIIVGAIAYACCGPTPEVFKGDPKDLRWAKEWLEDLKPDFPLAAPLLVPVSEASAASRFTSSVVSDGLNKIVSGQRSEIASNNDNVEVFVPEITAISQVSPG